MRPIANQDNRQWVTDNRQWAVDNRQWLARP